MISQKQDTKKTSRLLATLLRDVQKTERVDTLADWADALKWRCARLTIAWTPDDITNAFRLVLGPLGPR